MTRDDYQAMRQAVIDGDSGAAQLLARQAVESGQNLLEAIELGFAAGIRRVGELWDEGEYFLPELVQGAETMKAAMRVLQPALQGQGQARSKGVVVIGAVEGDLHDIGKGLVAVLLSAHGFQVHDLGASVPVEAFIARATELDADIVGASALLTTTMQVQARLAEALQASPLARRSRPVRLLLGGAPTSRAWAEKLGALHAENALEAVAVAEAALR